MLASRHPEVEISISHTDRKMRPGEAEGRDYFFVSRDEFKDMVERGEMLEWANVHGDLKGTSKRQLAAITKRGHFPLLEIDVQGWLQARRKLKNVTSVFILPPSIEVLWNRLEKRGTESEESRWRRLLNAKGEIEKANNYDFFIVNDRLEDAYDQLERITIKGEKGKVEPKEGAALCQQLIGEFTKIPWLKTLSEKFS